MAANSSERHHVIEKSAVALVLTFTAGFVDIVGYISAFKVFTAHMTGLTVHLAQGIAMRDTTHIVIGAGVLIAFVLGSLIGRLLIEASARRAIRSVATVTLCLEITLLVFAARLSITQTSLSAGIHAAAYRMLTCLAAAMGVQTATLTRIGSLTVHTTFVTGMINKFSQVLSHLLLHNYELARRASSRTSELLEQRRKKTREAAFFFSIWFFYLAGAVTGTFGAQAWSVRSLYVPVGLLIMVIAADQISPLAVEEEKEQGER